MTPQQCSEARRLLGWSRIKFAMQAECSAETIRTVEKGPGHPRLETLSTICAALETAGVEFTDGDAPSVRLRKSGQ
jgi:DNA-binding XRE family transcriptional regulator